MNSGLKQRLIGALVLAGIAVIFLPGFFKQHVPYQVNTRSQIPPRPNITPVVIDKPRASVTTASAPAPETMFLPDNEQPITNLDTGAADSSASPVAATPEARSASSVAAQQAASVAASVATAKPEQTTASDNALMADAWVVQVASLRSSESARQLRKRLQERGYKAYVRSAKTSQGEVSRVFIGPKLDKALAQEVKQEVDPVFKVNSMVLPFKP